MRGGRIRTALAGAVAVAHLLIAGAPGPADGGNRKARTMAEQTAPAKPVYARQYADERNSSCIDVAPTATGVRASRTRLAADKEPPFAPRYLLSAGTYLVACGRGRVSVVDQTGALLWTEEIWYDSPVQLAADKVYFRRRTGPINELGVRRLDGGQVPGPLYILDTHGSAGPIYIAVREKELVCLCVYQLGPEEGPPEFTLYTKEFGSKAYLWVQNVKASLIMPPLFVATLNKYLVFPSRHAVVYDARPGGGNFTEERTFPYPMRRPAACSAAKDGTLFIAGIDGNALLLAAVGLDGTEKWQWRQDSLLPLNREKVVPPSLGPQGLVLVSLDQVLTAVKEGTEVWHFDAPGVAALGPCTVLGDGSVLVCAGDTLYCLSVNGTVLWETKLDETLVTPPVCDQAGTVYAAGARTLFRIK